LLRRNKYEVTWMAGLEKERPEIGWVSGSMGFSRNKIPVSNEDVLRLEEEALAFHREGFE
jgi:hypothetical protein